MEHPAISFLKHFLEVIYNEKIPFVSLRYKPIVDEYAFSGDYDFIISPDRMNDFLRILFSLASASNINFSINKVKYGKVVITIFSNTDNKKIVLEVWTHLDVKQSDTLGYIFWEDIQKYLCDDGNTLSLSLDVEALYYLSHLRSKNKDLKVQLIQDRLHYYKNRLSDGFGTYSKWFEKLLQDASNFKETANLANKELVKKQILFTKIDIQKNKQAQSLRFKISLHRVYAQILKIVKIIPVVGPDGVGKTSIIGAIKSHTKSKIKYYRFKNLFRHNLLYQLSAPFFKKKLDKKVEKNQYDDIYGAWIVTIASCMFPFLVLQSFFARKIYFVDRYFHDFILQDTRFKEREAKLRENWKKLLRKTPNCFLFLHLDAPTDVILERKDELNNTAIDSYRKDVFEMYLEKPSMIYSYVNTSLSIESCTENILEVAESMGVKYR